MATIVTRAGKGAALTHAEMDANFTNLNNDKLEKFPAAGVTKLPFFQAAAPVGWTQDTANTDAMLRVVSGTGGGTGGTDSPVTGLTVTDSHVLTIPEMPAHTHTEKTVSAQSGATTSGTIGSPTTTNTGSTGGGGGHTHNVTFAPKFIDMIICSLD